MQHHQPRLEDTFLTRREFLCRCGMGMGALSLATFFGGVEGPAASARAEEDVSPLIPKPAQFPARARHVIHIFANGGPSHVDTFDPKPALKKYAGKPLPAGFTGGRGTQRPCMGSPFRFHKHGQS